MQLRLSVPAGAGRSQRDRRDARSATACRWGFSDHTLGIAAAIAAAALGATRDRETFHVLARDVWLDAANAHGARRIRALCRGAGDGCSDARACRVDKDDISPVSRYEAHFREKRGCVPRSSGRVMSSAQPILPSRSRATAFRRRATEELVGRKLIRAVAGRPQVRRRRSVLTCNQRNE